MAIPTPLKIVAKTPDPTMEVDLRSRQIWPENETHRLKWVRAVLYLRTNSKKGWAIDKMISKVPEERIL